MGIYTSTYRGYEEKVGMKQGTILNQGKTSQSVLSADAADLLAFALRNANASHGGRAFVGGWSMGSGVAWQLAAERPLEVAGLVSFCPWSTLWDVSMSYVSKLV